MPHSIPDFARLLGADAWSRLPAAVRARFGIEAHAAAATHYVGNTVVRASIAGRALAHLCRCIGTPVAPYVGESVPLRVRVYRNDDGIVWERRYAFAGRECVVKSTKQLDGNALVEKLGAGLHMRLRVFEVQGALNFVSDGYFFRVGQLTLPLPDWFLPGGTHVTHCDLGDGRFRFTMRTHHSWFGELFFQDGVFSERE
jgi:hypothetical protein